MKGFLAVCAFFCLVGLGCTPTQEIPVPSAGNADFSRVVVMGGSVMAGYRDGALSRNSQTTSIPNLIVGQLGSLGPDEFLQPLLPDGKGFGINVKPWESEFQTASVMGDRVDCLGDLSLGPVKELFNTPEAASYLASLPTATYHNLAVPFATWSDMLSILVGDPYFSRFTNNPGISTPAFMALQAAPSFVLAWPGLQDIYNYASNGCTGAKPDPNQFATFLNPFTSGGELAQAAVALIPKIEHLPFFTTIPPLSLTLTQSKADSLNDLYALGGINIGFTAGENGFVIIDSTIQGGFRQLAADEYLCLTTPLDSARCNFLGVLFQPMPDNYVIDQGELSELNALIDQYNALIRDFAAQNDYAVVDTRALYEQIHNGITVDAIDFSDTFVTGGFFSLDGFTPSTRGAGLVANAFIEAINNKFGASIPPVSVSLLPGIAFP